MVTFVPPALSVAPNQPYTVRVHFTMNFAVRRGAVLFYPPPAVTAECMETVFYVHFRSIVPELALTDGCASQEIDF